jgi:hypothetical protein
MKSSQTILALAAYHAQAGSLTFSDLSSGETCEMKFEPGGIGVSMPCEMRSATTTTLAAAVTNIELYLAHATASQAKPFNKTVDWASPPTDCDPDDDTVLTAACKCVAQTTFNDCATGKFCWADNTCNDAAKPLTWAMGSLGQTCDSVCAAHSKNCNPHMPATLTTDSLVAAAMAEAGHTCTGFHDHRTYPGAPFMGGSGGTKCTPWGEGLYGSGETQATCGTPYNIHGTKTVVKQLCYCDDYVA